jgi:hypothetical protein
MKRNEAPIPVRSVVCLPRWLLVFGVATSGACLLGGLVLVAYALLAAPPDAGGGWYGGWIGGGLGCVMGGAGGLFGTLADQRRRLAAPQLFALVQNDAPSPFYRRVFWPATGVAALSLVVGNATGEWRLVWGFLQTGGILAFVSGVTEAMRRHTVQQARALFALYADGVLAPDDAAAIEVARQRDPQFDAAVRGFQQVAQGLGGQRLDADAAMP